VKQPDPIVASKLTLTNPRFQRSLVAWIRKFVEELPRGDNARQIEAERFQRQSAALDALASFIGEQEVADPRLFLLAEVAGAQPGEKGWIHHKSFNPTRSQSRIFFGLGLGAPVAPETAFIRLVSAGLADTLRDHNIAHQRLEAQRRDADAARQEAEAKVAPLAEAEAERDRLSARLEAAGAQIATLQRRAADLEGFVVAAADTDGPRRVKVEGETGIYQAPSREHGLLYEIGYPDAEGKQRWKRLGPDASLEEARQVRERLAGQPHDPEQGGDTDDDEAATAEASQGDPGVGDGDQQTTEAEPVAAGRE
jgi:hypothetical protein